MAAPTLDSRIWRARRRGEWIDASIELHGERWRLRLTRKARSLGSWEFASREAAVEAGRLRLRELQRAGWTEHW
jgi:hypothetical protein